MKTQWGVYDRRHREDKTVHVSPCDDNGTIKGHADILAALQKGRT